MYYICGTCTFNVDREKSSVKKGSYFYIINVYMSGIMRTYSTCMLNKIIINCKNNYTRGD